MTALAADPRIWCSICERVINAPPGTVGTYLCGACAACPVLVSAFREGRARLVVAGAETVGVVA
jgi:hypothetical protein